jgi:hypothetical protein
MKLRETVVHHEQDLKWGSVTDMLIMQQNFFQPHALYRDIILSDSSNHSSFGPFHMMAGSTVHVAVPVCRQSGSTHFS